MTIRWLNGEKDNDQKRVWYYQLVSKIEIHRRGPGHDPYVYAEPEQR